MHALGQQVDASVPPSTVLQEVVRGYQWKDRILREAQVIVSGEANEQETGKQETGKQETGKTEEELKK